MACGCAPPPPLLREMVFPENPVRIVVLLVHSWQPCDRYSGRNGTSWAAVVAYTLWHGGPGLHSCNIWKSGLKLDPVYSDCHVMTLTRSFVERAVQKGALMASKLLSGLENTKSFVWHWAFICFFFVKLHYPPHLCGTLTSEYRTSWVPKTKAFALIDH